MITSLITVFGPVATYSNHTEAVFQQRYPRYTAEHLTTAQQLSEILVSAVTSMTLLASGALFGVEQPPSVFRSETQTNQGALHAMAAQMDTRPDLSEALFSMLNMCATRYPAALFAPPVFPTSSGTSPKLPDGFVHHVMALALAGLIMQERMSYKSDVQMLINLTALGKESSAVPNAVKVAVDGTMTSLGFHFVRELVNGLAASVPRTYLHLVADLLHKLVHRYPDGVRQWLKLSLGLPSMPGEQPLSDLVVTAAMRVSVTDREAFLRQMFSTRQIRPFKEATNEFALKCRGLHGTQYGQAT